MDNSVNTVIEKVQLSSRERYSYRDTATFMMLHKFYFSSSSIVSCAFSALCVRYACIRCLGIILIPRLPLCQILFLSHPPLLSELAHAEKSRTQSITHSSHSLIQLIWFPGNRSVHFGKYTRIITKWYVLFVR